MKFSGRTWKYGDDVDTDAIIPARHLNVSEADELALHCFEDLDGRFNELSRKGLVKGDILVAGANFGCGSSREHAPLAIKGSGISCVVAKSFARIFFRNAVNIGLPIIECPGAVDGIEAGHSVLVDTDEGIIRNLDTGPCWKIGKFPPFLEAIVNAGGLVQYGKSLLRRRQ